MSGVRSTCRTLRQLKTTPVTGPTTGASNRLQISLSKWHPWLTKCTNLQPDPASWMNLTSAKTWAVLALSRIWALTGKMHLILSRTLGLRTGLLQLLTCTTPRRGEVSRRQIFCCSQKTTRPQLASHSIGMRALVCRCRYIAITRGRLARINSTSRSISARCVIQGIMPTGKSRKRQGPKSV